MEEGAKLVSAAQQRTPKAAELAMQARGFPQDAYSPSSSPGPDSIPAARVSVCSASRSAMSCKRCMHHSSKTEVRWTTSHSVAASGEARRSRIQLWLPSPAAVCPQSQESELHSRVFGPCGAWPLPLRKDPTCRLENLAASPCTMLTLGPITACNSRTADVCIFHPQPTILTACTPASACMPQRCIATLCAKPPQCAYDKVLQSRRCGAGTDARHTGSAFSL